MASTCRWINGKVRIQILDGLGELERDGPLAGDHIGMVVRGHDRETGALGQRRHLRVAIVSVAVVPNHVGSVADRRLDLQSRGILGHQDRGRQAEPAGRDRDRLGVVPG
jgi:hypothetical protein